MKYFKENYNNMEELKKDYKKLVKKYHPDNGLQDDTAIKELNNELDKILQNLSNYLKDYNDINSVNIVNNFEDFEIKKEIFKNSSNFYEFILEYFINNIKCYNYYNPISNHQFSGNNIYILEYNTIKNGYKNCNYSTFAQYKDKKKKIRKNEHGVNILKAIAKKQNKNNLIEDKTKNNNNNNNNDDIDFYFKPYYVFNELQLENQNQKEIKEKNTILIA